MVDAVDPGEVSGRHLHEHHHHGHVRARVPADLGEDAPTPPAHFVRPPLRFDDEGRKTIISLATWEKWALGVAALIVIVGVFLLGRWTVYPDEEVRKIRSQAETEVSAANGRAKTAQDQLSDVLRRVAQAEGDLASCRSSLAVASALARNCQGNP